MNGHEGKLCIYGQLEFKLPSKQVCEVDWKAVSGTEGEKREGEVLMAKEGIEVEEPRTGGMRMRKPRAITQLVEPTGRCRS